MWRFSQICNMVKRLIFIALGCLLMVNCSYSQIVLGFNQWPDSGAVITYSLGNGATTVGDSGINKVWNYDTLQGFSDVDTLRVNSPRKYPNASLRLRNNSNQVISANGQNLFYNKRIRSSLSDVLLQGLYVEVPSGLIPGGDSILNFEFSPALKVFQENTSYGTRLTGSGRSNRFTIPFDTTLTLPGVGTINVDSLGFRANIVYDSRYNGWGTLQLPGGIWPALREQQTNRLTISVEVFTLIRILPILPPIPTWVPLPLPIPGFSYNSVMYWTNQFKLPALEISTDSAGTTTLNTRFQGGIPSGLSKAKKNSFLSIYPNPGQTELKVQTLNGFQAKEIEVYNLQGQLMAKDQVLEASPSFTIATSQWPSGVYWVRVSNGNTQSSQRWIKH